MSHADYPKIKLPLGRISLKDPYPAWFLDPRGVIQAANLLAFWLWEANIQSNFLGISVFDVLAANLRRIPVEQNSSFYEKKSAVVKRFDAGLHSPLYTSFISAMEANPKLKQIFDQAIPNPDYEWEYPLRITPPGAGDFTALLEFQVTVYRLTGDNGFLAVYIPTQTTVPVTEKQLSLLIDELGDNAYIWPKKAEQNNLENILIPTNIAHNVVTSRYSAYYPILIQNSLWYITGENKSQQLLLGESYLGKHFFELFFSPLLRQWQGSLWDTSAPRAIKYFDTFTASFRKEDHELHAQYQRVMERLLKLPGFQHLLNLSRNLTIHINLPENTETPFYTCRVLLPWPVSHDFTLQFRSMVQLIHEHSPDPSQRERYLVTLIPENYETEVGLILLHLFDAALLSEIGDTPLKHLLWGLAIMRTLEEGITKEDSDIQWEPIPAFKRILHEVNTKFSDPTINTAIHIIVELRVTVGRFAKEGILDKEILLEMIIKFIDGKLNLLSLKEFLTAELISYRTIDENSRFSNDTSRLSPRDQQIKQGMLVEGRLDIISKNELQTMVFDDEKEYERFTDYVFDKFDGDGLAFTNIPIITSVRINRQLLEQTQGLFAMRPLSKTDVDRALEKKGGELRS